MTTIEKINIEYTEAMEAMVRGDKLTANQKAVINIYNSLHAKKAGNSGKRTLKNHNNNW